MTDEQINALAREYAKATTPYDKDEFYYELAFHRNEKEFRKALQWLSARYAIVEKSKVLEEHHEARFTCCNVEPLSETIATSLAEKSLLERLFPELFKNEEK